MKPPEKVRIAVVEDDKIMGESLVQRLALEGYQPLWLETGDAALKALDRDGADLVICDIRLPDFSGEELYRRALPSLGKTPVIFVTAFGDVEQAVRLVRLGATDYLIKPYAIDLLLEKITAALAAAATRELDATAALGRSVAMQRIESVLRRVRDIDSTVLLTGETGVGKEVAARFLHSVSRRSAEPFVAVNCAAVPLELAESSFFGHEKGAFTGAHAAHAGFAEQAGAGVLFLDEIAELPPALQAKLLRLLQDRSFQRVGGERPLRFEARLVAATNAPIAQHVDSGAFRKDLYYRLNVIELNIPPLRERRDEIVDLLRHYAAHFAEAFKRDPIGLSPDAVSRANAHDWPGNIRELRNRVERADALTAGDTITAADLWPENDGEATPERGVASLAEARENAERDHIRAVLAQTGGQVAEAAALLKISRTTLWEKMRRLGLSQS